MIPKQIFFIWLGDNIPNYLNYSMCAYKNINPDFKIDLIHIHSRDVDYHNKTITESIAKRKVVRRAVVYKYAYDYIRKYGGFYVHADTYPIKPFNNNLLEFDIIKSVRFYNLRKNEEFLEDNIIKTDDILIAAKKDMDISNNSSKVAYLYINRYNANSKFFVKHKDDEYYNLFKNEALNFRKRREDFFNLNVNISNLSKYSSYLEHYEAGTKDDSNKPSKHYCPILD